jgi:hypothetical protein
MNIFEDAFPYFEKKLHALLAISIRRQYGQQNPCFFMTFYIFLPHCDKAIHVSIEFKRGAIFIHLKSYKSYEIVENEYL